MNQIINAPGAPGAIGPYSHAVLSDELLFTSGQIALDPETGKLVSGGIESQTRRVFSNLKAVLAAAGMDFSDVIKTTVYLSDLSDFSSVNNLYKTVFSVNPPARSCIQAAALPSGALIEIELVARKA